MLSILYFPRLITCTDDIIPLISAYLGGGGGGGGWSGGAMVLGKLPVPGRPTIWVQ